MYNNNETRVAIMKDMMAYIQHSLQSGRISFEEAIEALHRDIEQVYGGDMTSPSLMTAGYHKSMEDAEREKALLNMGQLNDGMILVDLPPVDGRRSSFSGRIWKDRCDAHGALYNTLCELSGRGMMIPGYLSACRVLVVPDQETLTYLEAQIAFARTIDRIDDLAEKLYYLVQSGSSRPTRTVLCRDFAPHSFVFTQQQVDDSGRKWTRLMNGGLIYSGPDQPLDGSAPAFTVSVGEAKTGWSIHT